MIRPVTTADLIICPKCHGPMNHPQTKNKDGFNEYKFDRLECMYGSTIPACHYQVLRPAETYPFVMCEQCRAPGCLDVQTHAPGCPVGTGREIQRETLEALRAIAQKPPLLDDWLKQEIRWLANKVLPLSPLSDQIRIQAVIDRVKEYK